MRLSKKLVATAMVATCMSAPAQGASLNTDVEVGLPGVLALYCYDSVHIDLTGGIGAGPAVTTTLSGTASGSSGTLVLNGDVSEIDVGLTSTAVVLPSGTDVTLKGVCAYRALTGANGVDVTVDSLNSVLEGPAGSTISTSQLRTRDTATAGAWQTDYTIVGADLGLSTVRGIDVQMQMNFLNALESGRYSSPDDGTFTITVLANP